MFRKAPNIKTELKLSDKEAKRLQADAARFLNLTAEQAALLFPRKPGMSVQKCGGGMAAKIYASDGVALAVDTGSALVPSLPSLWRLPAATFVTLLVPEQTAPFLIGGSDLMLPGVHGVRLQAGADAAAPLAAGAVACVCVLGNPAPFAVGILLVDQPQLAAQLESPGATKGRCLELVHVFGDALWLASGAPLPNGGFVVTEEGKAVRSLAEEGAPEGTFDGCALPLGAVERADEPAAADADAPDADADADADDDDDADDEHENAAAQDALLEACFLQAAHAIRDKSLPMPLNTLYAQHMRPGRPRGRSLDVRQSSHRKLLPFMRAMEARGLCALSTPAKGGEPALRAIERTAPEYRAHAPWEDTAAAATAEAAAAQRGGVPPLSVSLVLRPCEAQWPLFPDDRKALYDKPAALAYLHAHVDALAAAAAADDARAPAERAGGGALVTLDPALTDALFCGDGDGAARPTRLALGEVRVRWLARMEQWTRIGGGGLRRPTLHAGAAPKLLAVRTEQRRGHMVTVLSGLTALGLDEKAVRAVALELQAVVGGAAAVEEVTLQHGGPPRLDVMVQGLWDRTVIEHLRVAHDVPERLVDSKAASQPKAMQQKRVKAATNVRRS